MQHLPELCVSLCGAVALVAVLVLRVVPWLRYTWSRRGRGYVRVQDVPDGNGEWL